MCLTVINWDATVPPSVELEIDFDVMAETLKRSVIGGFCTQASRVNLERAVEASTPASTGTSCRATSTAPESSSRARRATSWEAVRFGLPADLARYVAEKGSIAVDGVSLTVTAVGPDWFEVGLIPETLRATTLGTTIGPATRLISRSTCWPSTSPD